MSLKRKYNLVDEDLPEVSTKKHTLDSDEEDSDEYEKDHNSDGYIEGEEDGVEKFRDDVQITPFNMREELQEGQFDKEGHYHWHNVDEIRDNWMDNIDWVKVDDKSTQLPPKDDNSNKACTNADEREVYKNLLSYMQRNETISQTLCRLGKSSAKISTIDRIKRKKRGEVDNDAKRIVMFTELADSLLTTTGNMDVYQLTYEFIQSKANEVSSSSKSGSGSCSDMYSDDFNEKEIKSLNGKSEDPNQKANTNKNFSKLLWEFKWRQQDTTVQGPYDTQNMMKFSKNGHFKSGVYVRKVGEGSHFYTSNRIDFDLYL